MTTYLLTWWPLFLIALVILNLIFFFLGFYFGYQWGCEDERGRTTKEFLTL